MRVAIWTKVFLVFNFCKSLLIEEGVWLALRPGTLFLTVTLVGVIQSNALVPQSGFPKTLFL